MSALRVGEQCIDTVGKPTPREVEVCRLMATGLDNTGISRALDLSLSTVFDKRVL
ncbi:LuxR C-terminal-related transcriptional regulator [Nonomuraea sp. NPDC049152]|uniref:LuxR C-terminal-related transcriptional regulator n=1 Tax=Nonomuraea sp. NPDC049152 TaxID=3154350 RepID=UPI0033F9D675